MMEIIFFFLNWTVVYSWFYVLKHFSQYVKTKFTILWIDIL